MHGNNITGYIAWLFAVILGTALGSVIPNPEMLGLDFALVAMFVSIFESQLAAMMQFVKLKKIGLILLAVTLSYFLLVIVISESLAVLLSTLIGCFVGVLLMSDNFILLAIGLSALVTWIPRIAPFILTKYKALPNFIIRFLNYLPITIIFALTLSSVVIERTGHLPSIKWLELLAVLPTFWVAAKTKNILLAVVAGVLIMAFLRFVF